MQVHGFEVEKLYTSQDDINKIEHYAGGILLKDTSDGQKVYVFYKRTSWERQHSFENENHGYILFPAVIKVQDSGERESVVCQELTAKFERPIGKETTAQLVCSGFRWQRNNWVLV